MKKNIEKALYYLFHLLIFKFRTIKMILTRHLLAILFILFLYLGFLTIYLVLWQEKQEIIGIKSNYLKYIK